MFIEPVPSFYGMALPRLKKSCNFISQINSVGYFLGRLLISSIPNPGHLLNVLTTALSVLAPTGKGGTLLGICLVRLLSWLGPGVGSWGHL